MTRKRLDELGALQQAVMEVIWSEREGTVQQVLDALKTDRRPAYTTVLSVLQKLERAGWVTHRSEGRTYVYSAHKTREEEGRNSLWSFIDGVFLFLLNSFLSCCSCHFKPLIAGTDQCTVFINRVSVDIDHDADITSYVSLGVGSTS